MEIYVQSLDYGLWDIIRRGPYIPKREIVADDGTRSLHPKVEEEFTDDDYARLTKNARAMNVLICGLNETEYARVSQCNSAHEAWKLLEMSYQGTAQVKNTKISLFISQYEMFKMEEGESLNHMHQTFSTIVNTLSSLGKTYPNDELNRKILFALPKEYKSKVTAIQESKYIDTITVHELICNLETEELVLNQEKLRDEQEKRIKKSLAFHVSNEKESEEDEDEMALFAKRFVKYKRFMKKGGGGKFTKKENKESSSEEIKCYNCDKPGHIKANCPKMAYKKKKKAMLANWDEESSEDDEDNEEVANVVCFMANDHDEVSSNSSLDNDDVSLYDLQKAFSSLHHEFSKLQKVEQKLIFELREEKKKVECLMDSSKLLLDFNDEFEKENLVLHQKEIVLEKEIESLRAKNVDLTKIVHNFTKGQETFEMMLGSQRLTFNKCGIGFESSKEQKSLVNMFVKSSFASRKTTSFKSSHVLCSYCERVGHGKSRCYFRKQLELGSLVPPSKRQVWIVKRKPNPSGPKPTWVPKS